VVATGSTTGFAFDGIGAPGGEAAGDVAYAAASSPTNVWAFGHDLFNGNAQDEGGPVVVLHFDGHAWSKLAAGQFGYGPDFQQFSSDGRGAKPVAELWQYS
jgi:hypothetical protein